MNTWDTSHSHPPLGIGYIASVLRENDIDVKIIDYSLIKDDKQLENKIGRYNADLIGISSMSPTYSTAKKMAEISKEIDNTVKVVVGGPHSSVMPEHALSDENIDIAVIGEGEYTMLDLVKSIDENKSLESIRGIYYKTSSGIKKTERREPIQNLDELPLPARDLLEMDYYLSNVVEFPILYPETNLIAVRGCPFNCSYCQPTARKIFGAKMRYRSPENVVDEMELITKEYKPSSINIGGDTLTMDKKWFYALCDEIKERGIDTPWYIGTRVDRVDKEMLQYMSAAGGYFIIFGVESGSQRILDEIMNKRITIEQIKNAFKWCKEANIFARANLMIGSPSETKEDILMTNDLIKEMRPDTTTISVTNPIPGTKLYDYAVEKGLLKVQDITRINRHAMGTMRRELSDEEVKGYVKLLWYTTTKLQLGYF